MKRVALFVLAGAMLLGVSNVSQANDCCCAKTSCMPKMSLPKLSLPKMNCLKSLFSMGCHQKNEACCPAPTCAAPAAAPVPYEATPAPAPIPEPPKELTPSAADQPKKK